MCPQTFSSALPPRPRSWLPTTRSPPSLLGKSRPLSASSSLASLPSTPSLRAPRPSPSTLRPRNKLCDWQELFVFRGSIAFLSFCVASGCHEWKSPGVHIKVASSLGFLNALRMVLLYGGNVFKRSTGFCGCTINIENRVSRQ